MNNLLASAIGFLNALLALVFIIGGAVSGSNLDVLLMKTFSLDVQLGNYGVILGLAIGFTLAIVVCGLLAIFISMRNELISIRRLLHKQTE